jgi:hypothetical protein
MLQELGRVMLIAEPVWASGQFGLEGGGLPEPDEAPVTPDPSVLPEPLDPCVVGGTPFPEPCGPQRRRCFLAERLWERMLLARALVHLPVAALLALAVWALAASTLVAARPSAPQTANAPIRASLRPIPLLRAVPFIPNQIGRQVRIQRTE